MEEADTFASIPRAFSAGTSRPSIIGAGGSSPRSNSCLFAQSPAAATGLLLYKQLLPFISNKNARSRDSLHRCRMVGGRDDRSEYLDLNGGSKGDLGGSMLSLELLEAELAEAGDDAHRCAKLPCVRVRC